MPYVEETGALVSLLVWLAFGAIAVVPAFENLTWQTVLHALLSLTVIRMAPVALALAGLMTPGYRRFLPAGSSAVLPDGGNRVWARLTAVYLDHPAGGCGSSRPGPAGQAGEM